MLTHVHQTTAHVVQHSTYVKINLPKLRKFAECLPTATFAQFSYVEPFHFIGDPTTTVKYILLLDTLNFGSSYALDWPDADADGIYPQVASAIKRLVENEADFSANDLATIQREQLADIFAVPNTFSLLSEFQHCWQALGHYLLSTHGGDFVQVFQHCQHSANALVTELATQLNAFRDITSYQGQPVYFLKKAQCLAADTWLALQGQGLGRFDDIARLTTFADNVIPQMLYAQGVLTYAPLLAEKIATATPLAAGSVYEVEIRAAAVQAVEQIRAYLAAQGKPVLSIQIDWYLWNLGQTPAYRAAPLHLTETIYY